MKALITIFCLLAVGLSYGAQIPAFGFGDYYNKTILRNHGGFSCEVNEYNQNQYCKCEAGKRISTFHSEHGSEDRKWTLKCEDIPGNPPVEDITVFESLRGIPIGKQEFDVEYIQDVKNVDNYNAQCWSKCNKHDGNCSWCSKNSWGGKCCRKERRKNECDGVIGGNRHHRCVPTAAVKSYDGFIVGMKSIRFSPGLPGLEDRQYSFLWQHIPGYTLQDCVWDYDINEYDRLVNYVLGPNQVLAGVKSVYSSKKRDRMFSVKVCNLVPRCSQLKEITYFPNEASDAVTSNIELGFIPYNNVRHDVEGEFTVTMTDSKTSAYANEYSFTRTDGHEMTASLEVSAGVNWGIGIGGEGSASITAGFASTWSTTKTWSRSKRQEITEAHDTEVSFKTKCSALKYCEATIIMNHGEVKIPYRIVAYTKGKVDDDCSETGFVTVKNSWNSRISVASFDGPCKCNDEGTVTKTDGSFDCLTAYNSNDDGKCTCKPGWTGYNCELKSQDAE